MADEAQRFIREVWSLQGTAYLVIGLRYYSRISTLGWRKLAWDDAIMALATVVYTAESVAAYFVVAYWKGLANNGMTDAQRAALSPDSEEYHLRVNGSKTHVIGLLLYTTLIWLLKACWIVYYGRLTGGIQNLAKLVKYSGYVMIVTYISCLLVAFLKCVPFDHQWQINPNPGNHCMPAVSYLQTIFVMTMNAITDILLMTIPLPMVWKSHLPSKKKFSLLIMFSGGLLEMAFGILRCVSILTVGDTDPAQSGYWSVRESFVSVVLANMPMLYTLARDLLGKTSNASTTAAGSGSYGLDGLGHRSAASKFPHSLPDKTTWDSEEHIVVYPEDKGGLGAEEASLESSDGNTRVGDETPGGAPKASAQRHSASRPGLSPGQILVTTEYTVADVGKNGGVGVTQADPARPV